MFEIADEFRRRGKRVVVGGPFANLCPEELPGSATCSSSARPSTPGRGSCATTRPARWQPEYHRTTRSTCPTRRRRASTCCKVDRYRAWPSSHARLPVHLRVLRHHRHVRPQAARPSRSRRSWPRSRPSTPRRRQHLLRRRQLHRQQGVRQGAAARPWRRGRRRSGYPLEFMTEVSLDVAQDDELLRLMRQANFTTSSSASSRRARRACRDAEDAERARRPRRRPSTGSRRDIWSWPA